MTSIHHYPQFGDTTLSSKHRLSNKPAIFISKAEPINAQKSKASTGTNTSKADISATVTAASADSKPILPFGKVNKQFASFLAGGLAGTVSSTITCPLEVVKTKLQASNVITSASQAGTETTNVLVRTIQEIFKNEGIKGFFRGWTPTVIGILPTRSVYFWSYSWSKNKLHDRFGDTAFVHVISAAFAGMFSNTLTNPIWALKTRMQLQAGAGGYTGYPDAVRKIMKTEGIAGFYRGLSASYWGVSEGAIHFVVYEKLKKYLHTKNIAESDDPETVHKTQHLNVVQYLATAAFSKLIASALTYPHEVVRTRMREIPKPGCAPRYQHMIQSLMLIGKEEGAKGLYAGMGTHLARVVPNTAIMFLTYEMVLKLVEKHNEKLAADASRASQSGAVKKVASAGLISKKNALRFHLESTRRANESSSKLSFIPSPSMPMSDCRPSSDPVDISTMLQTTASM